MSSSIFPNRAGPVHPVHEATWQKLVESYGYARAQLICQGRDEATNADLAAWNNLGGRRALRVVG